MLRPLAVKKLGEDLECMLRIATALIDQFVGKRAPADLERGENNHDANQASNN